MKIAFYCPNKPLTHPNPSGDQVIARGIHDALNAFGHDCREIARYRSRWFFRTPAGWAGALRALLRAKRAASAFQPDLWLTYHTYYKSPDVIGPVVSRLLGVPYCLFQPMYGTRKRKSAATKAGFVLNRRAIATARHAFVNNRDDLEALGRVLPASRLTHLPPGIFPEDFERNERLGLETRERFGIPPETPLVVTAARFREDVKTESLLYLLRSLTLMVDRVPAMRLLMVGDGPAERRVREAAEALLPGRVLFAGKVPREAMPRYYSAADLFVFPGIGESLGMVYLEAQSCGVPVVALESSGVSQVVASGKTGLLVPDDGGASLAEATALLLENAGLRSRLGEAAARFVREERNLRVNYRRLEEKLLECVAGGRENLPADSITISDSLP